MVKAESDSVHKYRGETMSFLGGNDLSRAEAAKFDVSYGIRGAVGSLVIQVGAEKAVLVGELVIEARGNKVLVDNLLTGERKNASVYFR